MNVGVKIQYHVDGAQQAIDLEEAVKELPGRITTENHANEGDSPRLVVTADSSGGVIIRPYLCRISQLEVESDVDITQDNRGDLSKGDYMLVCLERDGKNYSIMDNPLYVSNWK